MTCRQAVSAGWSLRLWTLDNGEKPRSAGELGEAERSLDAGRREQRESPGGQSQRGRQVQGGCCRHPGLAGHRGRHPAFSGNWCQGLGYVSPEGPGEEETGAALPGPMQMVLGALGLSCLEHGGSQSWGCREARGAEDQWKAVRGGQAKCPVENECVLGA